MNQRGRGSVKDIGIEAIAKTMGVHNILYPTYKKTAGFSRSLGRAFKGTIIFILKLLVPSRVLDTVYMLNTC